MSYPSGDAADQVVKMTLSGAEYAAKITGKAAERIAILLYAVLKGQKRTKGKTRLTNMLKSGKELKVFSIQDSDLERFCKEAKRYGVLYCVLKDKNATDGHTDIFVRAEDASKINRIFERFGIATADIGSVRSELERERENREEDIPEPDRSTTEMERDAQEEAFLDALLDPQPNREEPQNQNPTDGPTTESRPSGPTLEPREKTEAGTSKPEEPPRRSVKKELQEIKEEQRQRAEIAQKTKDTPQISPEHIPVPTKKPEKER